MNGGEAMETMKIITAAALFDGHDVSITIFSKLMHKRGAEVVHIGHNRSVDEILTAAVQEDADAVLVSSYQGGHNEFFKYLVDRLKEQCARHILVFGGGGGVILPEEIRDLETYGVARLYHATDGQTLGIHGIADDIVARIREAKQTGDRPEESLHDALSTGDHRRIAQLISRIERSISEPDRLLPLRDELRNADRKKTIVIGVTGTGGCGKSSLIDELINRFLKISDDITIGVLAVDPSRKNSGGAFLGDRIRYNSIYSSRVFFRSFATRGSSNELSLAIADSIGVMKACGFDLVFVETSGTGQGDSGVTAVADLSIFVMTSEFGAPSQLEKIDMLEMADFIVINKFEKTGSEDALRHVTAQYMKSRNMQISHTAPAADVHLPIYGTSSSQFNNHALNALFKDLLARTDAGGARSYSIRTGLVDALSTDEQQETGLIDHRRLNYLSEIAEAVRRYHEEARDEASVAGRCYALKESLSEFESDGTTKDDLVNRLSERWNQLQPETRAFLERWDELKHMYEQESITYSIQNDNRSMELAATSLSMLRIPKVALPRYSSWEELVRFFYEENLPGYFPFTAGVYTFKRTTEEPRRQFAGEGSPERTNARFHLLSRNDSAKRLSTAFDGITLYGEDPDEKPDIYGKIGESGVSVCTIEDMDRVFRGFTLTDPLTSVSMTINAPAPIMLAMYFMAAYRRELAAAEASGTKLDDRHKEELKLTTFRNLRGTVQADILKEDQAQNTCIFSIDFAMRLLGDVQEYFSQHGIDRYYTLSISGYHIAEAGANPITQLAFTLANGFTYVEYFMKRGLEVDSFAPNLSFFFSNGMEAEYSVIGRVARRIWAVALRRVYRASERSQKLKYHIQTSGRSLHAREIDFNDIRTTLQALLAYYDNCNSLHTNSYDEAITTPTEESVRRSMAIQLILAKEFGMNKNENPNQGSFIIDELTDLVEEAVLQEFDRLARRGGVLGAMETQYQRAKIQEESLYYEELKQSGDYPVVGVNMFLRDAGQEEHRPVNITRTSDDEKHNRIAAIDEFKQRNSEQSRQALLKLKEAVLSGRNIFAVLLETVEYASLGQITHLLYEVGGKYRRGF
ncbi:MAG TPA: fused isobutyryl-CoA mutase/GTPase IcmF [Bacteroidota bacterium]|nr:fused isobutyryl-CoA mutase/GTPase IcmF [Bacteroidota bacterium]